jgi:hypothetical protein
MTEQWGNYHPPGQNESFHPADDPVLEDWPDIGEDDEPDIESPDEPNGAENPEAEHDPAHDDEG